MLPQANFDKANKLLVDMDWEKLLVIPDLNQDLQNWEGTCMTIMDNCIPKCTLPRCSNFPWLSKSFKTLIYMYIEKLQTDILCNSGSKKQFWNAVMYLRKEQSAINS